MPRTDPRPQMRRGALVQCPQCGAEKWRALSELKRGYQYCSWRCYWLAREALTFDRLRGLKRCAMCSKWKPLDAFPHANNRKAIGSHGRQAYCSPCNLKKSNEWTLKNPEAKKRHRSQFYWRDAEKHRAKKRELSPQQRAEKNAKTRAWRKANMGKVLAWNKLRIHRKRAAGDGPDRWDLGWLICHQDARCTYCKEMLPDRKHLDHKTPISRGGLNELENMQWLCPTCNMKKGAKTHEEYSEALARERSGVLI